MEAKLKESLAKELDYIEERTQWELEAKSYFGEEMYDRLQQINEQREDAMIEIGGMGN